MTETEPSALLDVARDAAASVAADLRAAFRTEPGYEQKRDRHDIVTAHDGRAEAHIRGRIFDAVPDSTIIGEEDGTAGEGRVVWYVDPIDGTCNFASGIAQWCISIAAAVDGRLVAGVILDPSAGHEFTADLSGAWLNGEPIAARRRPEEHRAVLLTSFPNARHVRMCGQHAFEAQATILDAFLAVRNLGSGALQLAHVAAGWADAALGFSTNSWDVAAGALILEQAGGRFVGLDRGRLRQPAFLARDYYATGRTACFPTLDHVARSISERTQERQLPETIA